MTTMTAAASPLEPSQSQSGGTVRAITFDRFGSAEVLGIETLDRPDCGAEEVRIAVRAASVNPVDWHDMTGTPLIKRIADGWNPTASSRLGTDVAGIVEAVGDEVTRFAVGDEVFGTAAGTFAEVVAGPQETLAHKPSNVSFEQAAAVPVAGLTALQALRDHGRLQRGQHVLVNGASGGVGTFTVQLAKHLGAEVTGVCSARNVEMVKGLGADHVVDYSSQDFTANRGAYDLMVDNVGNRALSDCKRCLTAAGTYVVVSGPKGGPLGPVAHMVKSMLAFQLGRRRAAVFIAQPNKTDMELLATLLESAAIRSVIENTYSLNDVAAAFRALETGRTRGKLVVTM